MFLPCFRMVPRQNNQYKDQAVGNVNSIKDLCEMRDEIRALLLRFGFASRAVYPPYTRYPNRGWVPCFVGWMGR